MTTILIITTLFKKSGKNIKKTGHKNLTATLKNLPTIGLPWKSTVLAHPIFDTLVYELHPVFIVRGLILIQKEVKFIIFFLWWQRCRLPGWNQNFSFKFILFPTPTFETQPDQMQILIFFPQIASAIGVLTSSIGVRVRRYLGSMLVFFWRGGWLDDFARKACLWMVSTDNGYPMREPGS